MSGFAACLSSAAGSNEFPIKVIADLIDYRGGDGRGLHVEAGCALVHAARWATPEAVRERMPLRHAKNDVWLVADARIDNRAELIERLRGAVEHPLDTDADLILAAYEEWGLSCAEHLVGDFAFAVWDEAVGRLLVVRDHLGIKPVFYSHTSRGVVVASTLPAVLAAQDRSALDREYIAAYIAGVAPPQRTPWHEVHRLAPGHRLISDEAGLRVERWWTPSLEPLDISFDQAVSRILDLFDEAVRCRARTRDGVAAHVSGGFDSSTIASTLVRLGIRTTGVAIAFPEAEADETEFMGAVARHVGLDIHVLDADAIPVLDLAYEVGTHREPLYAPDAGETGATLEASVALGCTVCLSGVGGDEVLYGSDLASLDLLAGGHFRQGVAALRPEGRTVFRGGRWALATVVRESLGAAARRMGNAPMGRRLQQVDVRRRARALRSQFPWIRMQLTPPPRPARPRERTRAAHQRLAYFVDSTYNPLVYELADRLAAERGADLRFPFLDVRLVEMILRLPEDFIRWEGAYRGLHREAFATRLPRVVAARKDKGDMTRPYVGKVRRSVDRKTALAWLASIDDVVVSDEIMATYDAGQNAFDRPVGQPDGYSTWWALGATRLM